MTGGLPAWPKAKTVGPAILNAAVTREIIGRTRRALPRKISRRTHHGDLHEPHHANGDHIGRHTVARSDPCVESLRDDVDWCLAQRELEVDLRVGRQEASPDRRDDRRRRQMDRVNSQPSQGALALLVQVFESARDLTDCRPQPLEQAQAGIGHRYAARRAIHQPHPETLLQLSHRMAERGGFSSRFDCSMVRIRCGTHTQLEAAGHPGRAIRATPRASETSA